MRLYVGNLPWSVTQEDLEQRFATHGPISDARIITDRESGRSRGFGFVTYDNDEDGQDAIREENGADFMGRTLRVSEAQDKQRSSNGRGHRNGNRNGNHRGGGGGGGGGGHQDQQRRRRRKGHGERHEHR